MDEMSDRFGLEFEFNVCGRAEDETDRIAGLIRSAGLKAESRCWQYNNRNSIWICKPDASCGIEVCSPVFMRGDFREVEIVMGVLAEDAVSFDDSCSVHLHVDHGSGATSRDSDLCSLLAWWVKSEHIFVDFAAPSRKNNRYCKFIGETHLFDHSEDISLQRMMMKLSDKYLTLNTFHMFNGRRESVEFRMLEATKHFSLVRRWTDLIFHFSDRCRSSPPPGDYRWVPPRDFFSFMSFPEDVGQWFLGRLADNCLSGAGDAPRKNFNFDEYSALKSGPDFGQKNVI